MSNLDLENIRPLFRIVYEMDVDQTPSIRDIQLAICRRFTGVRPRDLNSARRSMNLVLPRHLAMYLARQLTLKSYPTIASGFGDRDHTTVLHACRKIERLARNDVKLLRLISSISSELGCGEFRKALLNDNEVAT